MSGLFVVLVATVWMSICTDDVTAAVEPVEISIESPVSAPPGSHWMQARAGIVPRASNEIAPLVVLTLQLKDNEGIHMFHGLSSMWTDNLGKTWHGPAPQRTLNRRVHDSGLIETPCDTTPMWHKATGKLLLTGATFWLDPKIKRHAADGPSDTPYSVYDPETRSWSQWRKLKLPADPRFHYARAGCTQRVDLPNGNILLPIYFGGGGNDSQHCVAIVRCGFNGETLTYLGHGDELCLDVDRGLGEPSLTRFGDRYFLTIRNDQAAYVATSRDGLHFSELISWKFDDGEDLGSYNTQQHWVTHSEGLFLAYTRRHANNDDVFRHRAPLFMARVDPVGLRVIRSTEQVVLPKLRNGFGNFGVCHVTPNETWVTAGRREAKPDEPSLYIARIRWSQPNAFAVGASR